MANKVYNLAGGLHSAAAYAGWENELFGGNAVASPTALQVGAGSGMTVSVGKGNALIDTGDDYSRRVALTEAVNVTLDQADTSLPRNDLIVIYVDMAVTPVQTVQDNTNGILKVVAVKGAPASSPSDPDSGTIQQTIGAGNPYMTLASIRVNAGASAISAGNITDKRPMSPNVYWTTSEIEGIADDQINDLVPSLALAQARTVSPRYSSRQTISSSSWTAPSNGIVYFIGNINTTQYASSLSVSVGGTVVWRTIWNVDAQNYNWDTSGNILVRQGDKLSFATSNGAVWSSRIFVPIN